MAARKTTSAKMGWPQRVEMNAAIIAAGMVSNEDDEFAYDDNKLATRALRIALLISDATHAHFNGDE